MYKIFESFQGYIETINEATKVVKKKVKMPMGGKALSDLFIIDKGVFRWNPSYKTYNSVEDNSILYDTDLDKINWSKSK